MEYYGHNDWRDYHLAHFGVKGMVWGKHKKKEDYAFNRPLARKKKVSAGGSGVQLHTSSNRPVARKKKTSSNGKGVSLHSLFSRLGKVGSR